MGDERADTLWQILNLFMSQGKVSDPNPEFWHGDCKGGDEEAHDIAHYLGYKTVLLPQNTRPEWRAHCEGDMILEPMEPLTRNRLMVDSTDLLLAAPPLPYRVRSGSWYTYDYAHGQRKRAWLL